MFKGPVVWTGKRLETRLNQIDLDQTASFSCMHFFFWMKHSQLDYLNRLQLSQNMPQKYLQNAPKNIENDQNLN